MNSWRYMFNFYLYLSTNSWNLSLIGYPACLIFMVSSIPKNLNCSKTTGISNFIGALSLFGFIHLTNQGLHFDIESKRLWRESENLAATVGVLGFIVTNRPLVPLGSVLVFPWFNNGFAKAFTSGSLEETSRSTISGRRISLFLSRNPSTWYQTCPAKWQIWNVWN